MIFENDNLEINLNRFFLVLFVLFPMYLYAEVKIPVDDEINRLIDSSLNANDMHVRDLRIPDDYYMPGSHRLNVINKLYSAPLLSKNLSEQTANIFLDKSPALNLQTITQITGLIDVKPFRVYEFDDIMSNENMEKVLGLNIDSTFGFPASIIVKQYLVPILRANSIIDNDILFSGKEDIKILKKYADSILYNNEKISNNPYSYNKSFERHSFIAEKYFEAAKVVNQTNIYNIGFSLYLKFSNLNTLTISNIPELKSQIKSKVVDTKLGKIAIGGTGNDTYSGNYILIIELGGKDKYNLKDLTKEIALLTPVRCIVDFSGNDDFAGGNYSLGGSFFGVNLLFDYSGDDNYHAGNISLGAANFGVGILHDYTGNDTYKSEYMSQGAGSFGIGLLIDEKGKDVYNSSSFSQGFGFTRGLGVLADREGSDSYYSLNAAKESGKTKTGSISFSQGASLGYKPFAGGGIGVLAEGGGNDIYKSEIYSQGTSYGTGLGALVDLSGDDRYHASHFAQGSGVHLGFGSLIDINGNDVYLSKGASQGYGYDLSYGSLFDINGNDKYGCDNQWLIPGKTNSVSMQLDMSGDDSYHIKINDDYKGYSDFRRDFGIIDLFIDGGGNNIYSDTINFSKIPTETTNPDYLELNFPINIQYQLYNEPDVKDFKLPKSVDSLFILASSPLKSFQKYVYPARDSLEVKGMQTIEHLLKNLISSNPLALDAIENIFDKMLKKDTAQIFDLFIDSLTSSNRTNFGIFSRVLSRNFPLESRIYLIFRLDDKDWRIRELAVQALSKSTESVVSKNLVEILNDPHPYVRAEAAKTVGTMKYENYLDELTDSFLDSMFIVRNSAMIGVISNLSPDYSFAKTMLSGSYPDKTKSALIKTLINLNLRDKEQKEFLDILLDQNVNVRQSFYDEVVSNKKSKWHKKISVLLKNETEQKLKKVLDDE